MTYSGFNPPYSGTKRTQDAPVVEPLQSGDTSAIVIGYGPVGQTVAQLLKENAIIPTIIELNVETVQSFYIRVQGNIWGCQPC